MQNGRHLFEGIVVLIYQLQLFISNEKDYYLDLKFSDGVLFSMFYP